MKNIELRIIADKSPKIYSQSHSSTNLRKFDAIGIKKTNNRKQKPCDSHIPASNFFAGFAKLHKLPCPYCGGDAAFLFPSARSAGELRCADLRCDRKLANIESGSEILGFSAPHCQIQSFQLSK